MKGDIPPEVQGCINLADHLAQKLKSWKYCGRELLRYDKKKAKRLEEKIQRHCARTLKYLKRRNLELDDLIPED